MRVLQVASECYPLVKTGGLADVVGALPAALAKHQLDARVLIPGYPGVAEKLADVRVAVRIRPELHGGAARVLSGTMMDGSKVLVLEAAHLFERAGGPYLDPAGRDHADNHRRFGALSWVAAQIALGNIGRWQPDIVHAHDWQAGLAPLYLHLAGSTTPTVMTIHNLAFQGVYPATVLDELGIPESVNTVDGIEFFGYISLLKAGLQYANALTTVSPTYAFEITTAEFGAALDGLLLTRSGDLSGIVNGIDTAVWDPSTDPLLPAHFTADDLSGKAANKAALQRECGLDVDPEAALFGVVSRLSQQKGFDLLIDALPTLMPHAQLVVLGSGDPSIEAELVQAAADNPGRVAIRVGYDEALAHRIQAGSDLMVVPSRFEPCGLTQLCALRYGTLPLVARVGGLADTVIDANVAAINANVGTGFVFGQPSAVALAHAFRRALHAWQDQDGWRAMQQRAMRSNVGWDQSAADYVALYRQLLASAQQ